MVRVRSKCAPWIHMYTISQTQSCSTHSTYQASQKTTSRKSMYPHSIMLIAPQAQYQRTRDLRTSCGKAFSSSPLVSTRAPNSSAFPRCSFTAAESFLDMPLCRVLNAMKVYLRGLAPGWLGWIWFSRPNSSMFLSNIDPICSSS